MAVLMAITALWCVIQLAVVGSVTRSVRFGSLVVAAFVGLYGCAVATLLIQWGWTRAVAWISGSSLFDLVQQAAYTVDPVVEEVVKVLPLLALGLRVRTRLQWGFSDYVLLGGALGAGFGLAEGVFRFGSAAASAMATEGGYLIPRGILSVPFVPGVGTTLSTWLPAAFGTYDLGLGQPLATNDHVVWSTVAGLGVAVLLRAQGPRRRPGLLLLAFAAADHAASNYALTLDYRAGHASWWARTAVWPFLQLDRVAWLIPLICLALAVVLDRREVRRGRAELPDVLTSGERSGRPALVVLGSYALVRLPWTFLVASRYVTTRRALFFLHARAPGTMVEPLHDAVRRVREEIDRTEQSAAWATVRGAAPSRPRASRRRLVLWILITLPTVGYLVVGGWPPTAALQRWLTSPGAFIVVLVLMALGVGWTLWRLALIGRGLPALLRLPYGEPAAREQLRVAVGVGAIVLAGCSLLALLRGAAPSDHLISTTHLLDAVGDSLVILGITLAIGAFFLFPPSGALALAGGGALAADVGALLTAEGAAALLGGAGVMLSQAAGSDSGPAESQAGSETAGGDFEGTGFDREELAQLTYQHTGAGALAGRPRYEQILQTLSRGTREELPGQNAVKFEFRDVRVIVNRDNPLRSTAYYTQGGG